MTTEQKFQKAYRAALAEARKVRENEQDARDMASAIATAITITGLSRDDIRKSPARDAAFAAIR